MCRYASVVVLPPLQEEVSKVIDEYQDEVGEGTGRAGQNGPQAGRPQGEERDGVYPTASKLSACFLCLSCHVLVCIITCLFALLKSAGW